MAIYKIPWDESIGEIHELDIGERCLSQLKEIDDYAAESASANARGAILRGINVADLIGFFDSLAKDWLGGGGGNIIGRMRDYGMSFLVTYMRQENLQRLMKESFRGDILCLDGFIARKGAGKKVMALPQGIATHWIAGNVPMLGMISLLNGLLSKNTNVLKLSSVNGLVLPLMAKEMSKHIFNRGQVKINGEDVLSSTLFVYCDREDTKAQEELSLNADVRIAWGGREAVETVVSLPKRYGTDDIIFGPKYSFAAVARSSYKEHKLEDIAYRLALDASVFEQQGCNSPHTVFIERGGDVEPVVFAEALAEAMEKVLKRIPKRDISANDAYTIVNTRSEYSLWGTVFRSSGTEWTVIYSEEKGLADPCYSRVVFVRGVDDIREVLDYIRPKRHQSLGLCMNERERDCFAMDAARRGIERVTDIGKMTVYDHPWDGMYPMSRMVRWVSSY